jgi:hypothetical protein
VNQFFLSLKYQILNREMFCISSIRKREVATGDLFVLEYVDVSQDL